MRKLRQTIWASALLLIVSSSLCALAADRQWEDCANASGDAGVRACTAILARRPAETPGNQAIAYNNRGVLQRELGNFAKAVEDYDEAIRLNPTYATPFNNRGSLNYKQNNNAKALEDANRAIQLDPKYVSPRILRGSVYHVQKDFTNALADYSEALRLDPKSVLARANRGLTYENLNQLENAAADFRAALLLDAKNDIAVSGLQRVAKAQGAAAGDTQWDDCTKADGETGIRACSAILARGSAENDVNRAIALNNRGLAYRYSNDFPKALADYEAAIALNKNYASPRSNRADIYYKQEQYAKALADYDEALKINPEHANSFFGRGNVHFVQDNFVKALADYDSMLRIEPKNIAAHTNRGLAFERLNDPARAADAFRAALALDAKYDSALKGLERVGKLLAQANPAPAGDKERADCGNLQGEAAIAACSAVLARVPPASGAARQRAFFNRAFERKRAGDLARALSDYSEALILDPKDGDAHNNRGNIYIAQQEYPKALADFAEAIAINPKDAAYRHNRGIAYENSGELDRAAQDFRAALAIDQHDETAAAGLARIAKLQPASPTACPAGERRVALVVGNAAYPGRARLDNPVYDAQDVAALLKARLCFTVLLAQDADYAAFTQKIGEFAEMAQGADVALFYYAGHGMQFGATNLLLPVDSKLQNEYDALHGNVSAQDLVALLGARAKFTLVFLDACRTNPLEDDFRRRLAVAGRGDGGVRGLAPMTGGNGETMVVFATRPNSQASDGVGRNSPFTTAFLKHMPTPDADVETVMRNIRASVRAQTDGRQVPQNLAELDHRLVLAPGK